MLQRFVPTRELLCAFRPFKATVQWQVGISPARAALTTVLSDGNRSHRTSLRPFPTWTFDKLGFFNASFGMHSSTPPTNTVGEERDDDELLMRFTDEQNDHVLSSVGTTTHLLQTRCRSRHRCIRLGTSPCIPTNWQRIFRQNFTTTLSQGYVGNHARSRSGC